MNYLSVCSGIEAATVAWHHLGWKPLAFSEIEPFPSAVLAHHYPHVTNLGNMTQFKEWNLGNESIDVLVGGTPCQSFSVAGLRQGLKDPRGNLMLTYLGIADRFRPQWIVWENVPGVLSSNKGRDFGTFVGALGELGYGWAYRILDAQWFGVAQRRRRVFVVANFGNTISAAKVLFERESVCRNPAPSREKGKGIATNVAPSLTASNDPSRSPQSSEITQQVNAILEAQVAACLRSGGNGGVPSSRGEHLVVGALCSDSHPGSYSGQDAYTGRLIATAFHPTQDPISSENASVAVMQSTAVRRLTPTECERLQGFPDGYTAIPWRKKQADQCPDGPRYKALGNSMAVPVMRWIGERIDKVEKGAAP